MNNELIASKELIEAFEGIGFKEEPLFKTYNVNYDINGKMYKHYTTQQLQHWLWKEKGLFIEVFHTHKQMNWEFEYGIGQLDKVIYCDFNLKFSNPSGALSDGLMKAVQLIERKANEQD